MRVCFLTGIIIICLKYLGVNDDKQRSGKAPNNGLYPHFLTKRIICALHFNYSPDILVILMTVIFQILASIFGFRYVHAYV